MQCVIILLRNEMKGALALVHLLQYSLYTHFENFFRDFLSFSFPLSCSNSLHPPFKISVQNDKLFDFSNCTHDLTRVLPFYTPCIFLKSLCILQRYFMNTIFLKKRLFLFVLWICVWSGGAVDWWMPDETDFDTFGRIFFTKNVMANSRKNSDIFCHSVCWIIAKIHYPIPFFVHYVIIPG